MEIIDSKKKLKMFLAADKYALGIPDNKYPINDFVYLFQHILRKHEYYENTNSSKVFRIIYKILHKVLGVVLGFSIPCNVFGPGLRINHYGCIVVNPKAKIGAFCDIHQCVNIGEDVNGNAPKIGNNCWIGPGAKIFGDICIGNNVMVGANSVVNKNFSSNYVIAGIPAKIINSTGNKYNRDFSKISDL